MAVTWRLDEPLLGDLFQAFAAPVAYRGAPPHVASVSRACYRRSRSAAAPPIPAPTGVELSWEGASVPLTTFVATATTCDVAPGTEEMTGRGKLRIRDRTFTDLVESTEPSIAGTNRPTLDIDFEPASGTGELRGRFRLSPSGSDGAWEGELSGRFEGGMVRATGLARGTGRLTGAVLHVSYRQIPEHPRTPPCAEPKAFFEMTGTILTAE